MTGTPAAREDILALRSYQAGAQIDGTIRLNANEAPLSGNGSALHRYPEVHPVTLRKRMADLFEMPPENILVTRGSSEAIDVLIRAWCRAYVDNVVTTPPTFSMYRVYADIQGVETIDAPLDGNDFSLDRRAVTEKCTALTKLIFICSPNNPTGALAAERDILDLLDSRRGKSLVVVDEAYIEFSDRRSLAARVLEYDNLVVLRTLSKAHALAGARCGAAIGCREIIDVMSRVLPPYSFPTPVIASVLAALSGEQAVRSAVAVSTIIAERERVRRELACLPCIDRTWPSQANFLLTRFRDLETVQQHLLSQKILIRDFSSTPGLSDSARITIGTAAENNALLGALKNLGDGR